MKKLWWKKFVCKILKHKYKILKEEKYENTYVCKRCKKVKKSITVAGADHALKNFFN